VKRSGLTLLGLVLLLGLGIWLLHRSRPSPPKDATNERHGTPAAVSAPPATHTNLLGEAILRGYADTNLPPENDLTLMSRLMENALLLLKSAANRPLSANEDWADLFRGKNAAREKFIPTNHMAFNAQGQLVDRWQAPLFFHALGGGRYELRSAGPDKTFWTDDDIHRNSDGSFRRGPDLNPPSLHEEPRQRPSY
jgi:hypothetical protein